MEECIAAIATALSPAGLGVIRLSGKNAIEIASKFFKSKQNILELEGYRALYGKIIDNDYVLDDGVILVFRAPNSYTGEDVVEISCHGGLLILEKVLKLCYLNGARPAKRGEFTKRAFLNSKISLTQAEAVKDLINADSVEYLKAVNRVKEGELYKKTREVIEKLIKEDGHISVYLDYPQEDIEEIEIDKLMLEIKKQKEKLEEILKGAKFKTILENGVNVSIVGRPNAGKSTIMNILCKEEKSIVTEIEGTTRDVLEHTIEINGVKFILKDTAGIRKTKDLVEKIGVLKAVETIKKSDIIVFISDDRTKEEDLEVLKENKDSRNILVYNKIDLGYIRKEFENYNFEYILETTKEDIKTVEKIKDRLYSLKEKEISNKETDILILNERQQAGIKKATKNLEEVMVYLEKGSYLDIVKELLDSAIENLLELTGEKVSDKIVDEIFKSFCVGK